MSFATEMARLVASNGRLESIANDTGGYTTILGLLRETWPDLAARFGEEFGELLADIQTGAFTFSGISDTIASGRAASTDGQYYNVRPGGADELPDTSLYKRVDASTSLFITSYLSADSVRSSIAALGQTVEQDFDWGVMNTLGMTILLHAEQRLSNATWAIGPDGLSINDVVTIEAEPLAIYSVKNALGFASLIVTASGVYAPSTASADFDDSQLDAYQQSNAGYSDAVRAKGNTLGARFIYDRCVIPVGPAQSNGIGTGCWPTLTLTPGDGLYMWGDCERPDPVSLSTYSTFGDAQLNPLSPVVTSGSDIISEEDVSAGLAPGLAVGESPWISMLSLLRRRHRLQYGPVIDAQKWVLLTAGHGSTGVADWQPGQDLYNRMLDGIQQVFDDADPGETVGVPVVPINIGEEDYGQGTSYEDYLAGMLAAIDGLTADIRAICVEQTEDPIFIIVQTGGSYQEDNCDIGNAINAIPGLRKNCYCIGNAYWMPDFNHFFANAARWIGLQGAKFLDRILLGNQGAAHMHPISAIRRGRSVVINLHCPVGSIETRTAYSFAGNGVPCDPENFADLGFSYWQQVDDVWTAIALSSVVIARGSVITAQLAFAPDGDAQAEHLGYALKTDKNGNGNVCDSDSYYTGFSYEYLPLRGARPPENVAALLGTEYDPRHALNAFKIAVTIEE